jgi:glycosyltransferase involved in cell wall biosynthesis
MTKVSTQESVQELAYAHQKIAVIIPCYNEETAVGATVAGFRAALPNAEIYVYDNNSSDRTMEMARNAGAIVRSERVQGKGAVVRRMFADVDADIYVMTDGDATYDPTAAPLMIERLVQQHLDMVVGTRESEAKAAYRPGHRFGNALLTGCVTHIFGRTFSDILSGYRVFSRRFVKSFPAMTQGFEIETEISVHALELKMPVAEVPTAYGARLEGSTSKLSTYRDGLRILRLIVDLFRAERPFAFFALIGVLLAAVAFVLVIPIFITYFQTGLVPRLPTAVLSVGLVILAFMLAGCGLILDTVTRGRLEMKRLFYVGHKR